MPKLIAKERFYYAGRNVEAGEEFEAEQQDVALLTNALRPMASDPSTQSSVDESRKKRRYSRRDMTAMEE